MAQLGRRTVIVEGSLAFQMRRLGAARAGECGVQILTLPQLAARLAGGFFHPVTAEILEPAVQNALNEGGFTELEAVRQLPGMRALSPAPCAGFGTRILTLVPWLPLDGRTSL